MEIEFDPKKEALNRRRHGLGFGDASRLFEGFRIDDEDHREDYGELRYVTLGRIGRKSWFALDTAGRPGPHHKPEEGGER